MYLYLGIYGSLLGTCARVSDFLNGAGTALHHGAAAFIISMLCAGIIPASRYIADPILILVMQHWVVLINYSSPALYSAIELVLEYYFEWTVLANYQQMYQLHWTAAMGAGVMLFAHWLYLIAAFLALFGGIEGNEGDANVHTRGQEHMDEERRIASSHQRMQHRSNNNRRATYTSIHLARACMAARTAEIENLLSSTNDKISSHNEEQLSFLVTSICQERHPNNNNALVDIQENVDDEAES